MSDSTIPKNPGATPRAEHLDSINEKTARKLDPTDPNLAAATGDYRHLDYLGEPVPDDDTADTAAAGDDPNGDDATDDEEATAKTRTAGRAG